MDALMELSILETHLTKYMKNDVGEFWFVGSLIEIGKKKAYICVKKKQKFEFELSNFKNYTIL